MVRDKEGCHTYHLITFFVLPEKLIVFSNHHWFTGLFNKQFFKK